MSRAFFSSFFRTRNFFCPANVKSLGGGTRSASLYPKPQVKNIFFCILFYSTFLSQKNLFRKRFFLRRDFDFLEEKRCQRRRTCCNPEVHWRVQVLKINAKHSYFTNPHTLYLSLSPSDTRLAFSFSHSVVSFKQTQSNFSQVPTQSLLLSKFASPPSHSLSLTHSLSHSVFYSVTFSHSLSLSNSLFTLYFFFSLSFYLTHLFLLY